MDRYAAPATRVVRILSAVAVALAVLSGCGPATDREADRDPTPSVGVSTGPAASLPARPVAHETLWLCRPGLPDNPCEGGLDATVVAEDGTRSTESFTAAPAPAADCFYVYPTVSEARTMTAPLEVTDAEIRTVRAQAARFTESCRVFAPIYRQITRNGLTGGGLGNAAARDQAYADVRSAFFDYLDHDNAGRPFVLVGHSQGAMMLTRLVAEEIDPDPQLRGRLLSALLLGGDVTTAPGRLDHGDFDHIPACTSAEESGCVVAYSTYAGTPPAYGLFGRAQQTAQVLCVSPAALLGRGRALTPYLPTARIMAGEPLVSDAPETGFVTLPGRVTGRCRTTEHFTWLDVRVNSSALDELPEVTAGRNAAWGLHKADVSIALGDLVDLVAAESAAWVERGGVPSGSTG